MLERAQHRTPVGGTKSGQIPTILRILHRRGVRRNGVHVVAQVTFEPGFTVVFAVLEQSFDMAGLAYGTSFR